MKSVAVLAVVGLGPTEATLLAVMALASLLLVLKPSPAGIGRMVGRILYPQRHRNRSPTTGQSQSQDKTPPGPTPDERGRGDPARPAGDCPAGSYLTWPIPRMLALLTLGIGGAVVGAGGSVEGLAVALVLNPLLWGAAYSFCQIGRIRCPHCRKSSSLGLAANYPVGSAVACGNCGNDFAKPAG